MTEKRIKQPEPGSKAEQVRALREARAERAKPPKSERIKAARQQLKSAEEQTAPATNPEESTPMRKTTTKKAKKTTAKKAKAKKVRAPKETAEPKEIRAGSKLETVVKLLRKPGGCTAKEVLDATEWPTVSMPQQARAAGIQLKKEKRDGVTYYSAA